MKKVLSLLSLALLVASCAPKAEPIDYGKEECAFCKMTIVSPQFASEGVTQKSKAYLPYFQRNREPYGSSLGCFCLP